jgi:long-subunit fatty acid transport protein
MLTAAMFRRLAVAVAVLSFTTFFAAEGFALANTNAIGHARSNLSTPNGWVLG